MNAIGLFGGPATGKSTVMRFYAKHLGMGITVKQKKLVYSIHGDVAILGIYDDRPFPGTDRLSATVIADACNFVSLANLQRIKTIAFEGDRLACDRFLASVENSGYSLKLIELCPSQETLYHRRLARSQNSTWIQTRDTKVANLKIKHPMLSMKNNDQADLQNVLEKMMEWTNGCRLRQSAD